MSQLSYPPVQQALNMLKDLSADAETQHRALVRERALHDERTLLQAAEQKGKLEGKLEGKIEGKQEALTLMVASGSAEARARAILDLSMDRTQAGRSVGGGGFFGLRARREPPGIA